MGASGEVITTFVTEVSQYLIGIVALIFVAQIEDLADAQRNLGTEGFLILVLSLTILALLWQIRSLIALHKQRNDTDEKRNDISAKQAESFWKIATSLERMTLNDTTQLTALEAILAIVQSNNPMLIEMKAVGLQSKTLLEDYQKDHKKTEANQTKKLDELLKLAESGQAVKTEVQSVLTLIQTMKAESETRNEERKEQLDQILDKVVTLASNVVTLDTKPMVAVEVEKAGTPL